MSLGAVFVEHRHGKPPLARDSRSVVHRDQRVRVARVADHEHAHVRSGVLLDGLTLAGENLAVDAEQVLAFHALLARDGADEDGPIDSLEPLGEVGGRDDSFEQRESAIFEFHHDAVEGLEGLLVGDFDEVEDDGLARAEQGAGRNPEEQRVANLPGGAGDGHAEGCGVHGCQIRSGEYRQPSVADNLEIAEASWSGAR